MSDSIFLSYSRRDVEAASSLYAKLKQAGHSVWFDKESLLPGQNWEYEIQKAIRDAKVVLICLSSSWVDQRGYVQKELKLSLETMKEVPEGQIHTIPVRLDDCTLPRGLAKLQWVDIFEPNGIDRLQRALQPYLSTSRRESPSVQSKVIDAYSEFLEDVIAKGGLIHVDPWAIAQSADELEFKRLLKGRWEESFDLFKARSYDEIIELWAPLEGNSLFRIDHEVWSDKPFFRCQIQTGKAHLFIAHVQLGVSDFKSTHMPRAFRLLTEVLTANPYSMKGGAEDRLPRESASVQNLNYRDTLEFAVEWLSGWRGMLEIYDIPESECKQVEKRVHQRLYEIDLLLEIRPPSA